MNENLVRVNCTKKNKPAPAFDFKFRLSNALLKST